MKIWSWRHAVQKAPIKSTTKHVLLNLSISMAEDGTSCFPSTKKQSSDTGLSERSICTHLDIAEQHGFIKKKSHGYSGKGWRRNEYVASYPEGTELASADQHKGTEPNTEGTEPNDIKALKEVQSNSSLNSSKNTTDIPDWIDEELFEAFVDMRVEIKSPLTCRAKNMLIKNLTKMKELGFNPNEALEKSVFNNWKGVFQPKEKSKGSNLSC